MRVSRCRSEEELTALDAVLDDFFTLSDGRYVQARVEEEFVKAEAQAFANQANGKLGGRPRKPKGNLAKTHSVSSGNRSDSEKNPNPLIHQSTNPVEAKSTVQPAAARSPFDDFWVAYPNKKGKQEAEKRWRREKLDGMADSIIAHVNMMKSADDGWRRGYAPMGSTYLNQARWTDEPQDAPMARAGPSSDAPQSKTLSAIQKLQGMKDGTLDAKRDSGRPEQAALPGA